jgi:hypothetical protein
MFRHYIHFQLFQTDNGQMLRIESHFQNLPRCASYKCAERKKANSKRHCVNSLSIYDGSMSANAPLPPPSCPKLDFLVVSRCADDEEETFCLSLLRLSGNWSQLEHQADKLQLIYFETPRS